MHVNTYIVAALVCRLFLGYYRTPRSSSVPGAFTSLKCAGCVIALVGSHPTTLISGACAGFLLDSWRVLILPKGLGRAPMGSQPVIFWNIRVRRPYLSSHFGLRILKN